MNITKEFREMKKRAMDEALDHFQCSAVYEQIQARLEDLEREIDDSFYEEQKVVLYDYMKIVSLMEQMEGENFYRQGMRDGIILLKELGVLA